MNNKPNVVVIGLTQLSSFYELFPVNVNDEIRQLLCILVDHLNDASSISDNLSLLIHELYSSYYFYRDIEDIAGSLMKSIGFENRESDFYELLTTFVLGVGYHIFNLFRQYGLYDDEGYLFFHPVDIGLNYIVLKKDGDLYLDF